MKQLFLIIIQFVFVGMSASAKESFLFLGPDKGTEVEFECVSEKNVVAKRVSRWTERTPPTAKADGTVLESQTQIDGQFDNAKRRYLWQVFTFSYLSMETKTDRMVGTIIGSIPNNLNTFTVGDAYKYEINSTNTRKSDGLPWKSHSSHELSIPKRKTIKWHGQNESVFLVKDTMKQKAPPLEKTMIHYFSARHNVTLQSETTVSDGQKNTCTLKKIP